VAAHVLAVTALALLYIRREGIAVSTQLRRRWLPGLIVGGLIGVVLVRNVLQQPVSPAPVGAALATDALWLGLVYGIADAVLLTLIPVLSLYGSAPPDAMRTASGRLARGAVALIGSLAVTAAYHAGFAEFRGPALLAPLIGNGLVTVAYLVSGSAVAPLTAHVMMHLAAVAHGLNTAVQLPPH
jgi:hypothetical protein